MSGRTVIIRPENMVNSPHERYFKYDEASRQFDMSGYNPTFIEGRVSIEQVQQFLARLRFEDMPIMDCCGCQYLENMRKKVMK